MGEDALVNLGAFALQVSAIVAAASLLLWALPLSAAARYVCWRVVLVACLVMPPVFHRTALPDRDVTTRPGLMTVEAPAEANVGATAGSAASPPAPWDVLAAFTIVLGAIARGGWLTIGLLRLRALRRRGVHVDDSDYDSLQRTLGTHATLRSVTGLAQPATFGVWRPVVLLPDTVRDAPPALRRAVVTHELFHVQRRDWLWLLGEEALGALLWFHPAIAWTTSRIQLAREELVDELTVVATGNRKAYIEALLVFADGGRVRPAPAFGRRRHLFTRIVRLSKERAMSSSRIVASAAVVIVAVCATGWYASSLFPMMAAAPSELNVPRRAAAPVAPPAVTPGVIPRPTAAAQGARSGGAARPSPAAVPAPAAGTETKPITPENPIPRRIASTPIPYPAQLRGSGYRGTVMVRVTLGASGTIDEVQRIYANVTADSPGVDRASAATMFFDAVAAAVRQWRYQSPAEPPIAFFVSARFDGEGDAAATQGDTPLTMVPREAVTAAAQAASALVSPSGRPPVRVGGNVRPPQKTRHVSPVYPPAAREARVQGVVILETLIDEQGRVADARILRSIPLLDQAALDAIRQWEFTPTLLNGAPVPLIMTATMQFSLPPQ